MSERDCKHGGQKGRCSECDVEELTTENAILVAELTALRSERDELKAALALATMTCSGICEKIADSYGDKPSWHLHLRDGANECYHAILSTHADADTDWLVKVRRLQAEHAWQLVELDAIDKALGTNEGHSAVTHIEILKAEWAAMRKGINAAEALMLETSGVYGLHLNGDVAPWHELRTGGRYEEWLLDFDAALEAEFALARAAIDAEKKVNL